jgi:hypothetical protein
MVEVVEDASQLPLGSHAISLHVSQKEAARKAAEFLAGAPPGQEAAYWVADEGLLPMYRESVAELAPERVGAVQVLDGPQVARVGPELRPVEEVTDFVRAHPEGVTGAGETITWYWTPEQIPDYLEYEEWFHQQARGASRFLCPYNLRDVPADDAPAILRALGARHSHVVLSSSSATTARVLQLFVFPTASDIPGGLRAELEWAVEEGYVSVAEDTGLLDLTEAGQELLVDWPD